MALRDEIRVKMEERGTKDLLDIWTTNDRAKWSDDAFQAIREVLAARGVDLPSQHVAVRPPRPVPVSLARCLKKCAPFLWVLVGILPILGSFVGCAVYGEQSDGLLTVLAIVQGPWAIIVAIAFGLWRLLRRLWT